MKLSVYGLKPLFTPRDPVEPNEATNKNYVDTLVSLHATDTALHLGAGQRALLDALVVTSAELNYSSGVVSAIQPQIDSKLPLTGGVLTGALTLHANPTDSMQAATKSYVDTEMQKPVLKTGGTMTGPLILSENPTGNMGAAPKQYVDAAIVTHANDESLHITAEQNTWLDSVTATAAEVNTLVGVGENVQTQLDSKFDKAGGTVDGSITLTTGHSVFVGTTPTAPTELVNKAYVDALASGQRWHNPVTDINLIAYGVNDPVELGVLAKGESFLTSAAPSSVSPVLAPLSAYTMTDTGLVRLNSVAVKAGDRYGVALTSPKATSGTDLEGKKGKLVTVVSYDGNSLVLTEDVSSPRSTTLVFDPDSTVFGITYTVTDEGEWTATNTSVNITTGLGLNLIGNMLRVDNGAGIKFNGNAVTLDIADSKPLFLSGNKLDLRINEDQLSVTEAGLLGLNSAVMSDVQNAVLVNKAATISATHTYGSNASLELGYVPTSDAQAVNKLYVDNKAGDVANSVTGLDTRLQVLELDPTTGTALSTGLSGKLDLTGGTLTGPLVLNGAPASANQASNKQYVDDKVSTHSLDESLHMTSAQNAMLDAITVSAAEINALAGITGNVEELLDEKLPLAGGSLTGPLTLAAAPVSELQAATKKYVDDADALKLNLAGGTVTGPIVLAADPVADLQAATKQYVDTKVSTSSSDLTTAVNGKVSKAGDTMTGALVLHAAPTVDLQAATKKYVDDGVNAVQEDVTLLTTGLRTDVTTLQGTVAILNADPVTKSYVDSQDATKLDLAGGTMTGYISLHAAPTQAMHPTSKQYVDALVQGLRVKASVRLATTANLAATYANGAFGVDSTLTATGNGALVVDGKAAVQGDRVLVRSQTVRAQNGDYTVQQVGNAGTPYILKRATTVDESHEVHGSYFFVFDGDTLKGTGWTFNVDVPATFAIGTDDIIVNQFSGQGSVIAGAGLVLTGNTISVQTANPGRIVVLEDSIDLALSGVSAGTYTKVTVDAYGRVTAATTPSSYVDLGLTDVQPLNARLSSVAGLTLGGFVAINASGVASSRSLAVEGVGLTIDNADGATGNPTVKSNATAAATAGTVVARDVSGNFAANEITASLLGNANTATVLRDSRAFSIESTELAAEAVNFNGSGAVVLNALLKPTGVAAGTYNKVTVDEKGRVTAATAETTAAGLGLTDVVTTTVLNARIAELEAQISSLHLYVMSRM